MIRPCQECRKNRATSKHHLFSQTKENRRAYGKLLDHPKNIRFLCDDCHLCKPVEKLTEAEFCQMFKIAPRTTSGMDRFNRDPWEVKDERRDAKGIA